MTPESIIDPKAAKHVRRLERRQEFRETFVLLLGQAEALAEYDTRNGYVYPELQQDLEAALNSFNPCAWETELLPALHRILRDDPCSTAGRIRELIDELLLVTELNTEDVCDELRTLNTEP